MGSMSGARGAGACPANFLGGGARSPGPGGFASEPLRACTCTRSEVSRYRKRVSGPLLDRIDVFVEVPRVEYDKLVAEPIDEALPLLRM